jgi:hypothetical protein
MQSRMRPLVRDWRPRASRNLAASIGRSQPILNLELSYAAAMRTNEQRYHAGNCPPHTD